MGARAIISVLPSLISLMNEERLARAYICESLHLSPQNRYITASYMELLKPQKADTRSAEEQAADIIRKAGLILK